ncbi:glutamine synthetase type III N terminal-domain-containing protein [Catenaria anguillulae PL171]|uniref:Glutamine synthetase type III N terminal-domain-containing protein n=1 Tax=Catenaria anguillulae PL171 TaxID=765915 RepID=A0A1Y2H6S2_9FUNG|nr:glutamine synthetase type III N terminal-domain-containing protein [Catenaria anguillulae PL171]
MIGAASSSPAAKPKKQKKGLSRILPSLLAPLRRLTGSSFARSFASSRSPTSSSPTGTPPDSSLHNTSTRDPLSPSAETSSWTLASSSSSSAPSSDEAAKTHIKDRISQFGAYSLDCDQLQARMPGKLHAQFERFVRHGGKLDQAVADAVAHAVRLWAEDLGASHFAHWLHPLTRATSLSTASHTSIHAVDTNGNGNATLATLDASYLPHGSLRSPTQAAGYTAWDLRSPIVLVDGVVLIPSVLVSHSGDAMDEKMPLIRAEEQVRQAGGACRVGCLIRFAVVDKIRGTNGLQVVVQRVFQQLALVGVLVTSSLADGELAQLELSPVSPSRALDHCDLAVQAIERAADDAQVQATLVEIDCTWTVSHSDLDPNSAQIVPLLALDRSRLVISASLDLFGSACATPFSEYWADVDKHLSHAPTSNALTQTAAVPSWIALPPGSSGRHFPTLALCALTSAAATLLATDESHTVRGSVLSLLTPTSPQSFIAAPAHSPSSASSCAAVLTESFLLAPTVFSARELHAFIHATMCRIAEDELDNARALAARMQGELLPRVVEYRAMLASAVTAVLATGVCEEEDVQMERATLECVTEKCRALEGVCERLGDLIEKGCVGTVEEVWIKVVKGDELKQVVEMARQVEVELQAMLPKKKCW